MRRHSAPSAWALSAWLGSFLLATVACTAAAAPAAPAAAPVAAAAQDSLKLTLPPVCYAVVGLPMSIYYDNIVVTPEPEKLHFQVNCRLGQAGDRAWTVTPQAGQAGDHDWEVTVIDAQGRRLAAAQCKLHVAPATAGSGGALRLLLVGDSLTHSPAYPNHIARLLAAPGNPAAKFLGTFRPVGVQPGVAHEGYGGWTWQRFASGYEPHPDGTYRKRSSPFVFLAGDGKPALDVGRYIQTACDGTPPDVVTFLLGTNDCFSAKADDPQSIDARVETMFKQADVLLAAFHQAAPRAELGVGLTVPGNSRESGFEANYHGKYHRWNWKQVQHELVRREIEHFGHRQDQHISLIPTELNLDPVDGFPVNNGCHPNEMGYKQIGTTIYAWIKARLQQREPASSTGGHAEKAPAKSRWPFFAMDNGVGRGTLSPTQQAELLKRLGYDGISYNFAAEPELRQRIAAFHEAGLPIFGVYFPTRVDKEPFFDPGCRKQVALLKGSQTVLWLLASGGKYRAEDGKAVRLVEQVADLAAEYGLRVAVYPHQPDYIKTVEDALRIVKRADRKNVGVSMTQFHEWIAGKGDQIPETIRAAAPYLMMVTINGAARPGPGHAGILPLGQGDFDVLPILRALRDVDYHGPVGLMCFGLKGEPEKNLGPSLEAWKKYQALLAEK